MSTKISERVSSMAVSATLAMAAKAREYKERGVEVISLSLGEPDFKTPKHICEGAKEAIDTGKYFGYPPAPGYLDLRQAISEKLKRENSVSYEPTQIVVSNGAKQSLANLFMAIVDPGDEVVVFAPYWVTYTAQIEMFGGKPVIIDGALENGFKPTPAQLEAAITPKTKAIIYSSPSNPTGAVFTVEELDEIAKVMEQHPDVLVIADEIYEHIVYDGEHKSIASIRNMKEQTVIVNGFAKGFAMTGWRVGYIAAPLAIAKACSKVQGQLTSANASISQRAAYVALTTDLKPTFEMRDAYNKRRKMVYALLKDIDGLKVNLPNGAFYFFPDVSSFFGKKTPEGDTIVNAGELSMYLLEKAHVSTVAGDGFGAPKCLRLSYAASEEDLKKALSQIKEALQNLK